MVNSKKIPPRFSCHQFERFHDAYDKADYEQRGDLFKNGFEVTGSRRHSRQQLLTPDWALNDVLFRAILLRVFPKLHENSKQRAQAARWAAIIYLFYRMGLSEGEISAELGGVLSPDSVRDTRRNICRAAIGLPCGRNRSK